MPESAAAYQARVPGDAERILSRCWICFEIAPRHATAPHVLQCRLVFIEIEQEDEAPSDD